ncbi:MAG TPA: alkaline phosphatase family protein [Bryobacteraceae bacterium]|nr:alkaline phosphatase family protein [Bryobacteraceae bacterium]
MRYGVIAFAAVCLLFAESACRKANVASNAHGKKVIVLGIDGMDPAFLERHWNDLPNLDHLRHEGSFERLATTTPPQSPVAWSTFITGMKPTGHGIFDFVQRNPDTLLPRSSMGESVPGKFSIPIGPYLLPLSGGHVETFRKGTPFWKILSQHGVPVTILRMPTNFPPVKTKGRSLSGMGTPDLRGTFGEFSFYTDDPDRKPGAVSGGGIIRVQVIDGQVILKVQGPANPLRKDHAPTYVNVTAFVDPTAPAVRFDVGDQRIVLREGEWSRWIHVQFPLIPWIQSTAGMFRIYVKQLHPRFEVYISPINIDPNKPELPITDPDSYSQQIARAVGSFYTQGMAQDTAAYRQHVFTRAEYIRQSREVSDELLKVLGYGLDHFKDGVLFFHFFGVDQNSHMLWGKYEDELLDTYKLVDRTVGWVEKRAKDATLIVMSDHGFTTFDRAVNLNTWLRQEGFLALTDPNEKSGGEFFKNVDWSHTKAYSVGLNALYVNQLDRERYGIVAPGEETEALLKNIQSRLQTFRDPLNGKPVVYEAALPFGPGGATSDFGPDMVVGYYPGYRSSWQTALGAAPPELIVDNDDEWRGDHCIAPQFVPGTLLTNRPVALQHPHLYDLTATMLSEFGIQKPEQMVGRSIF